MDKSKRKTITVLIPIKIFEEIEALVKKGVFSTKNDFIRYSILRALEENKKYLEG